jgi:uncharacterized protein (AIM24 family)
MNNFSSALIILILLTGYSVHSQNVTITPSGITPTLSGTYPRLPYDDIVALPSPVTGDIAYDLTFLCLRVYNGTKWVCTYQDPSNFSPNITTFNTFGATGSDAGRAIAVDASGNVFVTGQFHQVGNFGGTPTPNSGFNGFLVKYNSSGVFQWVQTIVGSSNAGNGIDVDANGNVFVTGDFHGTVNFDGISKTSVDGSADIFVAKYNGSGVIQWVQTAGGSSFDAGADITIDASGNAFVTGYFQETANFGAVSKTSAGSTDIFVAKYNSSGVLQFVQTAGGTGFDIGSGIAVDGSGKPIVTGYFQETANFGAISKTSTGSGDIFVAKYDPVGVSWSWVQTAGGTSFDNGDGVAVDASGSIFISGHFQGTADFNGTSKTSVGDSDIFVAKYNNSGTVQWVQTAGGTSLDSSSEIALDTSGNVFITGSFEETASFGNISKTSAGNADIFVTKYDNSGAVQWVQTAGGTSSPISVSDRGTGIVVDANGNAFITGYFVGTANFGAISKTANAFEDFFVARIQE